MNSTGEEQSNKMVIKKIKGEKPHFSKTLKKLMKKHGQRIDDLVQSIPLPPRKAKTDDYTAGYAKISNWRLSKSLPTNVELKRLKGFYAALGDDLSYYSWLYSKSPNIYVKNFISQLDDAFRQVYIKYNQQPSFVILDMRLSEREIGKLRQKFEGLFIQLFNYVKAISEKDHYDATGVYGSDRIFYLYFQKFASKNTRFVKEFLDDLDINHLVTDENVSDPLGKIIKNQLDVDINHIGAIRANSLENRLAAMYEAATSQSALFNENYHDLIGILQQDAAKHEKELALQDELDDETLKFLKRLEVLNQKRLDMNVK
ncbi:MAG: hypothetical protein ABF750_08090 [Oenococcus oeni]